MSYLLAYLLLCLASAAACYFLASRRNRDAIFWAVLGFFTGLIGFLVLLVIGRGK